MYHRKDASLDILAQFGNVAQFVSYEPIEGDEPMQTFSRIAGSPENHTFATVDEAVATLLERASDGTVNVRSYTPDNPRSREFLYGLRTPEEASAAVRRLSREGLHVIVNETIDIEDGGVSGVIQGGVIEFAPDDTPRCVEKPGTASLPLDLGLDLLEIVYGFRPVLPEVDGRLEFSIHPKPRGWQASRCLLWELEATAPVHAKARMTWPNRFSRHIGDKAYGLVMAHLAGMPVPQSLVIPRRIAPFSFGRTAGGDSVWIRTCPAEPEPGLYTTHKGWLDPFALLSREDPDHARIASVISQAGVPAHHSGAALVDAEGVIVVEGVSGEGDSFMLGTANPTALPVGVRRDVETLMHRLDGLFGPVRIEWVHDGSTTWIVQLHLGATVSTATTLVPGDRSEWTEFTVDQGLEALRLLLPTLGQATGLKLIGDVGMTSHFADLVRKSGVPTRLIRTEDA